MTPPRLRRRPPPPTTTPGTVFPRQARSHRPPTAVAARPPRTPNPPSPDQRFRSFTDLDAPGAASVPLLFEILSPRPENPGRSGICPPETRVLGTRNSIWHLQLRVPVRAEGARHPDLDPTREARPVQLSRAPARRPRSDRRRPRYPPTTGRGRRAPPAANRRSRRASSRRGARSATRSRPATRPA